MTIAERMQAAIARSNELDMKLARRIGEHIDKTAAGLNEIISAPAEPLALPESTVAQFRTISDNDLKHMLKAYGIKGIYSRNGKRLKKADRVALAVQHKIPAYSYRFLLDFYLQQTQ